MLSLLLVSLFLSSLLAATGLAQSYDERMRQEVRDAFETNDISKATHAFRELSNRNDVFNEAIQQASVEMIEQFIRVDSKLVNTPSGESFPIHIAAKRGDVAVVKLLVNNNANPRVKDSMGWTLLHTIAHNPCQPAEGIDELIEYLLSQKVPVDGKNIFGATPLMFACMTNNNAIAKSLITHHANTTLKDTYGRTALTYAKDNGNDELRILLSNS